MEDLDQQTSERKRRREVLFMWIFALIQMMEKNHALSSVSNPSHLTSPPCYHQLPGSIADREGHGASITWSYCDSGTVLSPQDCSLRSTALRVESHRSIVLCNANDFAMGVN